MTPTEQDKELQEQLVETTLSILGITDRSRGNRPEQIATLEQEIAAYITAQNNAIYEAVMEAIGDDEYMPPSKPTTKFSKPTSIDYRNGLRTELRQSINKIFGKE